MIRLRFLFMVALFTLFCNPNVRSQPFQQKSVRVEVRKVEKKLLGTTITLNGTVQPRYETTLGAEVSGRLEQVFVEEGAAVRKKQILALIDPDRYKALYKAAEARKKKTSQDLARGRSLFEEGFLSAEELDRRQTDDDTARASWEITRIDLKNAKVSAPFDGIITKRFVDPGAWLDKGNPILEISDLSVVHVMVPVPERLIGMTAAGQEARLTVSSAPGREFKGRVRAVIPKADQGKNFPVKIEVENSDGILKNGMYARVRLTLQSPSEVLMVSKDAVVHQEQGDMVFVIRDEKAFRARVRTGREAGPLIEVHGPLKAGDWVVVTGNENLHDGESVKIVNLPPQP